MSRALKPRKTFQDYLREAKNPQTSAKRLESLFTHVPVVKTCKMTREKQILAMHCALARNPNVPPNLMRALCNAGYLRDARTNPTLALLAIEDPSTWMLYVNGIEASVETSVLQTAWDKRSKEGGGVKVTEKDLTPFQELTQRVLALCISYRLSVNYLLVHFVPAMRAAPNTLSPTQRPVLELTWRGYSRIPLGIDRVKYWLSAAESKVGRSKDLSARIQVNSDAQKRRLVSMLEKEGFTSASPGLKCKGKGLQVYLSEKYTFDKKTPVVYLRLTNNMKGDPHLFDNFQEWHQQ